jgi:DNA-binding transcriptional ArsR family regulator
MTNAHTILTALGDPTRQAILDLLLDGPQPVGELAARLPVSRPAVSQHLKVLKEVGLVVDRQEGTRRVYRVDAAGLVPLRAYLERFWQKAMVAFVEYAENHAELNTDNIADKPSPKEQDR